MPFTYPPTRHQRKHGPQGYERYQSFKDWLRDEFTFRCVYCLERERWHPGGQAAFAVDHVKPKGKAAYAHLLCDYRNLVYACNRCNSAKADRLLLDPCRAGFARHVSIAPDGSIAATTKEGKRLIRILGLDLEGPTKVRRYYLRLAALYQQSPHHAELRELYLYAFGFPDDLPDLASLRPVANVKPAGIQTCYRRQREAGNLSATY